VRWMHLYYAVHILIDKHVFFFVYKKDWLFFNVKHVFSGPTIYQSQGPPTKQLMVPFPQYKLIQMVIYIYIYIYIYKLSKLKKGLNTAYKTTVFVYIVPCP
jgi:hypothetical protein